MGSSMMMLANNLFLLNQIQFCQWGVARWCWPPRIQRRKIMSTRRPLCMRRGTHSCMALGREGSCLFTRPYDFLCYKLFVLFDLGICINTSFTHLFRDKIVSMQFMRKYIHIAKNVKPILTRAASDYIAEAYAKLRNQDNLTQDHIARVWCYKLTNI